MTIRATGGAPRIRVARLAGPSAVLDRRVNAVRPDLADAALAGAVIAPRYADGVSMRGGIGCAMLRAGPDDDATAVSALLLGEDFTVFDLSGGWAWGQCGHDRYVGWVRASALAAAGPPPSHRIATPAATVFAAPGIKSRVVAALPLNARLAAEPVSDDFFSAAGGFVHRRHLAPAAARGGDPAGLALGFAGTPYVWGGRSRDGIDCSGLVQAVLIASGIACPRDCDQQRDAFATIAAADRRRGDLVVFPGHIGILVDPGTLLHANAYWMTTRVEPLADAVARLVPTGYRRAGA